MEMTSSQVPHEMACRSRADKTDNIRHVTLSDAAFVFHPFWEGGQPLVAAGMRWHAKPKMENS